VRRPAGRQRRLDPYLGDPTELLLLARWRQGFTGTQGKNQGFLSREMRRQVKENAMEIGGKSMDMRGKP